MKPHLLATIAAIFIASSAHAQSTFTIAGNDHYGCIHEADYDQTSKYVAQNDREAFATFLGLGIATGVCTMFKANEPVIVTDAGFLKSKVRRKGQLAEYWIATQALEK